MRYTFCWLSLRGLGYLPLLNKLRISMPAMYQAHKPLRVEQSLRPPALGSPRIFSVRSAAHLFYQRYLFGVFESASRLESKR